MSVVWTVPKNLSESRVVSKFGGTSMADGKAMRQSAKVSSARKTKLVVVSATAGTTNKLIEVGQLASFGQREKAFESVMDIKRRHLEISVDVQNTADEIKKLEAMFSELEALAEGIFLLRETSARAMDNLVSLGERMSSLLFLGACRQEGLKPQLLDARDVIRTDAQFGRAIPDVNTTAKLANEKLIPHLTSDITFVTQGFIGSTKEGVTTTLGRGGSDYSAALFAEAISSPICEIWTDVPGVATTDPRICQQAKVIEELSFEETSEMASLGAKVLHPATLLPAMRKNIPVLVASTFEPEKPGTFILKKGETSPRVRAVTLKKKQNLITLTNPEMAFAHGFLFNVYRIFHEHKISVDAITTSQIAVAMTLDEPVRSNIDFMESLKSVASVGLEEGLSLISVVGYEITNIPLLLEHIFEVIDKKAIRMVCFGASRFSVNLLVRDEDGPELVRILHRRFLE